MADKYKSIEEYIAEIPEDRKGPFLELKKTVQENLPSGFEECLHYNMIGYVVPHSTYPDGYHCDTSLPLPFINIANKKNFIALYHMGLYASPEIYDWFVREYPNHTKYKLDMGKSCIRFKKIDQIPLDLIAQLCKKFSVKGWIALYDKTLKK